MKNPLTDPVTLTFQPQNHAASRISCTKFEHFENFVFSYAANKQTDKQTNKQTDGPEGPYSGRQTAKRSRIYRTDTSLTKLIELTQTHNTRLMRTRVHYHSHIVVVSERGL